ncbi:MAG: hypothetical protein C0621_04015 [Desulfuromonas sp.]|nr:MAG: hypothetical protein C0621_04015 [Desulfuromonas sp.]
MSSKSYSAGDVTDARCTRCRALTNHTIIAMVGETIARVQCNTCGGSHNYRPPAKPKAEKVTTGIAPKTPKARAPKKSSEAQQWLDACSATDPAGLRAYSMESAFKAGEQFAHPTFGIGLVQSVQKPNRMEALFRDGVKVLRCRL